MATKQRTIVYLLDQAASAGVVTAKKMFGEYALYLGEKVVAFVCDDQLFIKPTEAGKAFLGEPDLRPAYPGSKLYYFIDGDHWEDRDWLAKLIRVTAEELPAPVKKPKKAKKA